MAIPERVRGRGHRTANRLEAGAGVRSREDLQLHLGAGSESGNELPLSGVELAGLTWCGGGGCVALSRLFCGFPALAKLSQLFPGARRRRVCSLQGAEVQPRATGLKLPSWSLLEPGPRKGVRLPSVHIYWKVHTYVIGGMLAPGPRSPWIVVCLLCTLQGLWQIMELNEEGASLPSLHSLTFRGDGTDGGNLRSWGEIWTGT